MLALTPLHDRGEEHEPGALGQGQDLVHHLAHGLGREPRAVRGAVWLAGAGVEESQIVVDLGHRPDRRAGLCEVDFCSMEIAGDSPSMESTSGFCITDRNCRA